MFVESLFLSISKWKGNFELSSKEKVDLSRVGIKPARNIHFTLPTNLSRKSKSLSRTARRYARRADIPASRTYNPLVAI